MTNNIKEESMNVKLEVDEEEANDAFDLASDWNVNNIVIKQELMEEGPGEPNATADSGHVKTESDGVVLDESEIAALAEAFENINFELELRRERQGEDDGSLQSEAAGSGKNFGNQMNNGIKTEIKQEPMENDEQEKSSATASGLTDEARQLAIENCVRSLVHACQCKDVKCPLTSCQRMKRVVAHIKTCRRHTSGGCPICKQLVALCCYHSRHCKKLMCWVPFCLNIKLKIKQLRHHKRLQQAQLLRQRTGLLAQGSGRPECASATCAKANRATGPNTPDIQKQSTSHTCLIHTTPSASIAATEGQRGCGYAEPLGLSQSQQQQPGQPGIGSMDGQMPRQPGMIAGPAARVGQNAVYKQGLQQLMQVLRSPNTPAQQNQILHILESNPSLMAAFMKARQEFALQTQARQHGGGLNQSQQ